MSANDCAIANFHSRHNSGVTADPYIVPNVNAFALSKACGRRRLFENTKVDRERRRAVVNVTAFAVKLYATCN